MPKRNNKKPITDLPDLRKAIVAIKIDTFVGKKFGDMRWLAEAAECAIRRGKTGIRDNEPRQVDPQ